jgi:DNA transformation protein
MDQATKDFHEYVMHDVLGHINGITSKAMFGGYGIYLDGVIFGMITESDELRFKANAQTKEKYEALGGQQFIYHGHKSKTPTSMPYWQVPEAIMEDRERVEDWAREAATLAKKV